MIIQFEIIYRSNYDKNLQLNYTCTDVRIKICFETLNKYTKESKKHTYFRLKIYIKSYHLYSITI